MTPTQEDVLAALRAYGAKTSQAAAIKLMKEKGGADSLSKLDPTKYAIVIAAAQFDASKTLTTIKTMYGRKKVTPNDLHGRLGKVGEQAFAARRKRAP